MRRIRYQVACSLDGYISGPNGEIDWIPMDPEIDFGEIFNQFDTLLMGRRTYEELPMDAPEYQGMRIIVFSRTLRQEDHLGVTVVADEVEQKLDELRSTPGKDIWLFGGGDLFRSLLDIGYVDTVEPAVIPILLGGGRSLLPTPAIRQDLALTGQRVYEKSGIVLLTYDVVQSAVARNSERKGTAHQ